MDEEVREQLEKYPYLKKFSFLFISMSDFQELGKGDQIEIDDTKISVELLRRILNNDYYYSYTKNVFDKKTGDFVSTFIIYGDTGSSLKYTRSELFFALDDYVNEHSINAIERERYNNLKQSISLSGLKRNFAGEKISINIDGTDYDINCSDIIELLEFNDEEFDELCFNPETKDFHGIKKEHFIFAAYQFILQNKLIDNYVLPEEVMDRIEDITSMQIIDVESLDSPTKIKGINSEYDEISDLYKSLKVDDDLKNAILSGMDANFTDLEKALYIYIMMCKVLTYDEEYYAVNQTGPATEKHKQKEYIEEITLDHNEVVCFEFDLIYSKFLNDLGLPFHINNESFDNEYGEAHANIQYKCGKYLVSADSVTSILRGDMTNAKLGKPLAGLTCLNKNETTRIEFSEALEHVYSYIKDKDKRNKPLDLLVQEYRETTSSIIGVPLMDKLDILLEEVRRADFAPIDDYSYVMELRRILFTPDEQRDNIVFTIMRDPNPRQEGKVAETTAIFTINELGFKNPDGFEEYYMYKPHEPIRRLEGQELLEMLAYGKLEYIKADSVEIPGLETGGKAV